MQKKLTNIADLLNQYRNSHEISGLAVSIIGEGEVVYSQGFGTYEVEHPYKLVTPETMFSIQGITQSLTASALLHLEEHSAFDLDMPVVEYLPYFKTQAGDYEKITTAHLLSHTSGFQEDFRLTDLLDEGLYQFVRGMPEYKPMLRAVPDIDDVLESLISREEVTRYVSRLSLASEPGERFSFFSDGYIIAADVLEKVSGMSWEGYVDAHIFEKLGMGETTVNLPTALDGKTVASYYMKGTSIQTPTPHNQVGAPVVSVYSTATDLSKFLLGLMEPGALLSGESLENMFTGRNGGYGLGWKMSDELGFKAMEQTGSAPGVSSSITLIPEKQFGIVFLCNTDLIQLDKLGRRIVRRWFG